MSTDGRNVNVFRVILQFGAMCLATSSVHVLTVRCAARDTGRLTRNANTLSLKTLPYGRNQLHVSASDGNHHHVDHKNAIRKCLQLQWQLQSRAGAGLICNKVACRLCK
jgi:hypothetical protein